MYKKILLPVDGSQGAAAVLHHASELAHWMDATIHLLFVADTARDSVTAVEQSVVDALAREGEDVVEEAGETLETLGASYETDVVQGAPAPTIVDYARRYEHDVIVMPTHGREGLSRYLLGSVTEKVVRLSPVPVLTARMRSEETVAFPYERILVPTDGSRRSTRAARHGLALAASLDAAVHVLSVVDDVSLGFDVRSTASTAELEQIAADAVRAVVSEAEDHGVAEVVTHVERGRPAEEIRRSIESNDVHAVVMGTTGRRGVDRILLGSVAEKTVRSSPVPVITVASDQ